MHGGVLRITRRIPPQRPIESFYRPPTGALCQGTACFAARGLNPQRWVEACRQETRTYCLGKCYLGPASTEDDAPANLSLRSRTAVILDPSKPDWTLGMDRPPEDLIAQVERSELRGRGGAGFPTARKWKAVHAQTSEIKYVVVNADEGDPGAFIDRVIMERFPHRLLEGMSIAMRAVGAKRGIIYLRTEYPQALSPLLKTIQEAGLDIDVIRGRGSYVCGEETAMLNSIEERRPEVRTRPPYPTEHGLYGRPTLVNNVETLAAVPWIVRHGGDAYREMGFSKSRGTKLVSLNSLFRNPGLFEVEFGMPVRRICDELGGGLKTGPVKGVLIGGPLAGIVPADLLDTPFGFEELHAVGASVGHGGVVAFDASMPIRDLVEHVLSFAAYESCAKCTPCRIGNAALVDAIRSNRLDRETWQAIVRALSRTSLCGLGTGAAEFAQSVSRYFGKELESCFT